MDDFTVNWIIGVGVGAVVVFLFFALKMHVVLRKFFEGLMYCMSFAVIACYGLGGNRHASAEAEYEQNHTSYKAKLSNGGCFPYALIVLACIGFPPLIIIAIPLIPVWWLISRWVLANVPDDNDSRVRHEDIRGTNTFSDFQGS